MRAEDVKLGMKVRFDRDGVQSTGIVVKTETDSDGDCLVRVTGKRRKECTEWDYADMDHAALPRDGHYWYVAPREMREIKPRAKKPKATLPELFQEAVKPARKYDAFKVGDEVSFCADGMHLIGKVSCVNPSDGDLTVLAEGFGERFVYFDEGDTAELVTSALLTEATPDPLPTPGADPKAKFGATKPNLALNPGVAAAHQALAQEDGAMKYGAYNWRKSRVEMMTYLAAAKRHLEAFIDGQDSTTDTKVSNLGAVMACCAIVLDATHYGTVVDNRPKVEGVVGCASVQESLQAFKKVEWEGRVVDYKAWVAE